MSYIENHLRNWLLNHKCINLSCVEKSCGMKQRDLSFFVNERRHLKVDEFFKVSKFLGDYGFVSLDSE
ncbi:hypothetical protein EV196_11351 [Mariniflexile fucanivorans]|uniref:XRE family transcriptional regulator n=1 Tax=Mariniflexile fucanivorans TaxID=264023 RepID=A0A4R1RA59_9FLAO|nr:hypothetical protein EV196_11351 [Mariniflexile fucanivorans]